MTNAMATNQNCLSPSKSFSDLSSLTAVKDTFYQPQVMLQRQPKVFSRRELLARRARRELEEEHRGEAANGYVLVGAQSLLHCERAFATSIRAIPFSLSRIVEKTS